MPHLGEGFRSLLDGVQLPGDDRLDGAVIVDGEDIALCLVTDLGNGSRFAADNGIHGAGMTFPRLLHGGSPGADDPKTVLHGHNAVGTKGGILSQGVSGHGDGGRQMLLAKGIAG